MIVSLDVLETFREDLLISEGREQCGLLLGTQDVVRSRLLAGSQSWSTGFDLDQNWLLEQLYEARRRRLQLLGFYHSHPSGASLRPSRSDLDGHPIGSKVLIYSEDKGRFQWVLYDFSPTEDGSRYRWLAGSPLPTNGAKISEQK